MNLRTPSRRLGATLLLVAVAGTTLASCGDDKQASSKPANVTKIEGISIGNATNLKVKPTIDIPDIEPPAKLVSNDLVVGTGATVRAGQQLTARYVGRSWTTNSEFDTSWNKKPQEVPFTLADGSVIAGWVEGLPGMKVGGRRLLIIPAAQGYGDQGQGTTIAPGETLVFIVDAKKTEKAPVAASAGDASGLDQEALQQAIQQQMQGQTQAP